MTMWRLLASNYHKAKPQRIIRNPTRSRSDRAGSRNKDCKSRCFSTHTNNASSAGTTTYYDSQSGLHVPIHREDEVTLIVDKSRGQFIPPQLYREDISSDMPDRLEELVQKGIMGIKIPPLVYPRDVRNIKTLSDIAPSVNFSIFVPSMAHSQKIQTASMSRVSIVYEFQDLTLLSTSSSSSIQDDGNGTSIQLPDTATTTTTTSTTIRFGQEEICNSSPISIANQVATLIDTKKLGDYLWLSCPSSSSSITDDVIRLYEELIYLDVPGPTIKSRLIVEPQYDHIELIEEAMMSGISKFVISEVDDETKSIGVIEEIAKEQGKIILRSN